MKIKVINPFGGTETYGKKQFARCKRDDVEFDMENIAEYYPLKNNQWLYNLHDCKNGTIEKAIKANKEGYDAIVLCCNSDVALYEIRSLVDVPVTSSFESAAIQCHLMGNSYSFIANDYQLGRRQKLTLDMYGLTERLVSFRVVGWDANDLYLDKTPEEVMLDRAIKVAKQCVEEDFAESIIPACTLFESVMLENIDYCEKQIGAPIVSGMMMAFKLAESLVDLKKKCGISFVSRVGQFQKMPKQYYEELRTFLGRPL